MSAYLREDLAQWESHKGRAGITWTEGRRAGFDEGRMFRNFVELSIAGSGVFVIRVVVPVNTVLFGLDVNIDSGHLKLETVVGGTPGGTFSTTVNPIPQNNMSTHGIYTAQNVTTTGGTLTGGTVLDVVRLKVDSVSNRVSTVGNVGGDERGVAPNTYYFRLTALTADAVNGVMRVRWEERP